MKPLGRVLVIACVLAACLVDLVRAQTRVTVSQGGTYGIMLPPTLELWARRPERLWLFVDAASADVDPVALWEQPPTAVHFSDAPDTLRICVLKDNVDWCASLGEFKRWVTPQ